MRQHSLRVTRSRWRLFVVFVLIVGSGVGSTPQTISVCELFNNPHQYSGKTVRVRGIYWYGLRETCSRQFKTNGHVWPTAINLVDSEYMKDDGGTVSFVTDRDSWDSLDRLVIAEGKAKKKEEIWVTVIGRLEPLAQQRNDGTITGGYGHLGEYPAQLVVKRIVDVAIKARPTYAYADLSEARTRRLPNR